MSKFQYVASGAFHIALTMLIYVLYSVYPPYAVPVPLFDTLVYLVGAAYGVAGILLLRAYVRAPQQAAFNYALLVIVCGGLIFIAEGIGNAS